MSAFFDDLGSTLAWIGVSLAIMAAGFALLDALTPGKLREQVSANLNAGVLVGAKLLSVAIIIFAAVWTAPDALDEGLVQAALYSLLGLLVSALTFVLIDAALPVKLRNLVGEARFNPATAVAVGAELGVALVIAAAIS